MPDTGAVSLSQNVFKSYVMESVRYADSSDKNAFENAVACCLAGEQAKLAEKCPDGGAAALSAFEALILGRCALKATVTNAATQSSGDDGSTAFQAPSSSLFVSGSASERNLFYENQIDLIKALAILKAASGSQSLTNSHGCETIQTKACPDPSFLPFIKDLPASLKRAALFRKKSFKKSKKDKDERTLKDHEARSGCSRGIDTIFTDPLPFS